MGKGTRYSEIERLLNRHYKGGKVLEIGAGAVKYSDIFSDYTGTDIPGSKYAESEPIDVYCDARALPFKKNSFDFVFGIAVFYLMEEPEKAFDNLSDVLTPGGSFAIFDYSAEAQKSILQRYQAIDKEGQFSFWTDQELRSLLIQHGFEKIQKLEYYNPVIRFAKWLLRRKKSWLVFHAFKPMLNNKEN